MVAVAVTAGRRCCDQGLLLLCEQLQEREVSAAPHQHQEELLLLWQTDVLHHSHSVYAATRPQRDAVVQ